MTGQGDGSAGAGAAAAAGADAGGRQRFGRVIDRQPSGSGPGGRQGTYFISDDETGTTYSFSYADIVTEGFRTVRTGERARFLIDPAVPGHAIYVIRLDLPDVEELYEQPRLKPTALQHYPSIQVTRH